MNSLIRAALAAAVLAFAAAPAVATDVPKAKQTTLAKYITAKETVDTLATERAKVLFVDVRTRAELQFVGWTPEVDGQVPFVEMNEFGDWDEKNNRFKLDANPAFSAGVEKLLAAKGLGKSDKIILMCRSGDRSARAVDALANAGFTNVYSQIDGFEGDLSKDGRRDVNGWKNAGLAWTYKLDKGKLYFPQR